jgi:hypothetical protein
LFLDILKIADNRKLRVFLFGGEHGEQEKAKEILAKSYTNVVFKTHHSVADETALMLMLFNLQDFPTMKDMPKLTSKISLFYHVFMLLLLPLNILWCSFLTVVCLPKENNGFKNP